MIKQFFKKVLISYLIIICCIYTPTAQAANWSFGGYNFGNGSLNIVKDGVKITTAAVDSAPITSNLGKKILGGALRGASLINAISIIAGLGSDAIDWVLDPANNAIKYKVPAVSGQYVIDYPSYYVGGLDDTAAHSCKARGNQYGYVYKSFIKELHTDGKSYFITCFYQSGGPINTVVSPYSAEATTKSIPIPTVAQQILNNAKSGDTNAQADVTAAVTELVNAGTYDTPINQAIQDAINSGALPKDDTANPTDPTKPEIDTSSIIAAIQSLASSFASSIANAFNGITSVINTSIDKLLNKQEEMKGEVVNVGSKVDSMGGKVEGLNDNVKDVGGKVVGVGDAVKDVGGKVVGLNDSVDKVGDKVVGVGDKVVGVGDKVDAVGDKVTAAGDKVGEKVDAVGDKVTGVGADVRGVGDKVTATGEKVDAVGDKVADAVKDSTKEITDKMEQTKPKDFELPAFCSWASKVCDFIDWVKQEPDQPEDGTLSESTKDYDWQSKANGGYVSFGGSCPAPVLIPIRYMGASTDLTISYTPFCQFATMIKPAVILSAYIAALMIISGGRTKE